MKTFAEKWPKSQARCQPRQETEASSRVHTLPISNMNEELGYVVDQIDNLTPALEGISAKLTTSKLKKQFPTEAITKDMTALKETLVVLKGDNYVGTAEPQLREKISGLYGEVAGYAGRPSNAQMANLKVLADKLSAAKSKVDAWKSQLSALAPAMLKAQLSEIKVRSFEEFKMSDL